MTVWPLNDKEISIHALRKESDSTFRLVEFHLDISIHALRKESDGNSLRIHWLCSRFQSTLSVRRATHLR